MIAAMYIKEPYFLFDKAQTINLGGKYLYEFSADALTITRKLNPQYVENFFSISSNNGKSESNIGLITAIVGKNGAGKSRLLSLFDLQGETLDLGVKLNIYRVIENGENIAVYKLGNQLQYKLDTKNEELETFIYYNNSKKDSQENVEIPIKTSIYYSPHVDLKTFPRYSETNGYLDISADYYINKDLESSKTDSIAYLAQKDLERKLDFILSEEGKEVTKSEQFKNYNYGNIKFYIHDIEKGDKSGAIYGEEKLLNHPTNSPNKFLLISIILLLKEAKVLNNDMSEIQNESAENLLELINNKINSEDLKKEISDIAQKLSGVYLHYPPTITKINNIYKAVNYILSIDLVQRVYKVYKSIVDKYTFIPAEENQGMNTMEFHPGYNLSSGENAFLNLYARLYASLNDWKSININKKDILLLLDEADLGFHPAWKKQYIKTLIETLPRLFDKDAKLQIIFATHDALSLSDMPDNNVVFLKKDTNGKTIVLNNEDKVRPRKTFGANITDILSNAFFVEDGLIGDFAKHKIEEVIYWINKEKQLQYMPKNDADKAKFKEQLAHNKKVVALIDEPVIRRKLTEMITDLAPDNEYYNAAIDEQIKYLQSLKK